MNYKYIFLVGFIIFLGSCGVPKQSSKTANKNLPIAFNDTLSQENNIAQLNWRTYFDDVFLVSLIDEALKNNQELNIILQEIEISKNEVQARKGEYLPFVNIGGVAGVEKEARYTRLGALEKNIDIEPDKEFPEPLPNFDAGLRASWELDVWKKLRNSKKVALMHYLASVEGKNFMVTNLVAEIADAYYELMALDNLLKTIEQNIELQRNVLQIIKQEKQAAKVSQLAVNRFEAQYLNTQNLQFQVRQQIIEVENHINFLLGRFPQPIERNSALFTDLSVDSLHAGIPSQLLANRPDIRRAELELQAANLDIQVARANFYPSFRIEAGLGFAAFNPAYLLRPESLLYGLGGDLIAPLVNKNAIKAVYKNANAKQVQTAYEYEQTILQAYIEVVNQLAKIDNLRKSFELKNREVEILGQSIAISNNLFKSARADYMEVLLTQREAIDARIELIEIKKQQLQTKVMLYKVLGGGWTN